MWNVVVISVECDVREIKDEGGGERDGRERGKGEGGWRRW